MNKLKKLLLIPLFSLIASQLHGAYEVVINYVVPEGNDAETKAFRDNLKPIYVTIDTTQSYPGSTSCSWGLFNAKCLKTRWCNFYHEKVDPGTKKVLNFGDINKVCQGPCTKQVRIYDHTKEKILVEKDKFVGGLTACSSIEVWFGYKPDAQGKPTPEPYLIVTDWTHRFMDFFKKHIEPIATAGLEFLKIIPNAAQTAAKTLMVGPLVIALNVELLSEKASLDLANKLKPHIKKIYDQIDTIISSGKIPYLELKKRMPSLVAADLNGFFTSLELTDADKKMVEPLFTQLLAINKEIQQRVDKINFKDAIKQARRIIQMGSESFIHIADIVKALPSIAVHHGIIDPLKKARTDIDTLNSQLDQLEKAQFFNTQLLLTNILKTMIESLDSVDVDKEKVLNEIFENTKNNIAAINNLIKHLAEELQKLIEGFQKLAKIKITIVEELLKPDNFILMIPPAIGLVGSLAKTIFTFGDALPELERAAKNILSAVQQPIRDVIRVILGQAGIGRITQALATVISVLTQTGDQAIKALDNLKANFDLSTLPAATEKLVLEIGQTIQKITDDLNSITTEIPLLAK